MSTFEAREYFVYDRYAYYQAEDQDWETGDLILLNSFPYPVVTKFPGGRPGFFDGRGHFVTRNRDGNLYKKIVSQEFQDNMYQKYEHLIGLTVKKVFEEDSTMVAVHFDNDEIHLAHNTLEFCEHFVDYKVAAIEMTKHTSGGICFRAKVPCPVYFGSGGLNLPTGMHLFR